MLRDLREEAWLRQCELAAAVTITPRQLRYMESGERRTRQSTLERVADFLALVLDEDPLDLLCDMVEVGHAVIASESDHSDKLEVRRRPRAKRLLLEELTTERLRKIADRRSLPEQRRRAARATLAALKRNAQC